jgi:hypothetical protein
MRRALFIFAGLFLVAGVVGIVVSPGKPSRLIASALPAPQGSVHPSPAEGGATFHFFANSSRVEMGRFYRFRLYTHCGLNELVDFDGSLWDYSGPGSPDDGNRNPPAGFANPYDDGTMKLISANVAEYQSSKGAVVRYTRRSGQKQLRMCM